MLKHDVLKGPFKNSKYKVLNYLRIHAGYAFGSSYAVAKRVSMESQSFTDDQSFQWMCLHR